MKFDKESTETRREKLVEMLTRGVYDVTFTKVNGEIRCMPCTLRSDIIPAIEPKENKQDQKKKNNPDNMSVWCINKKEWRSFKIANVIEVIPCE